MLVGEGEGDEGSVLMTLPAMQVWGLCEVAGRFAAREGGAWWGPDTAMLADGREHNKGSSLTRAPFPVPHRDRPRRRAQQRPLLLGSASLARARARGATHCCPRGQAWAAQLPAAGKVAQGTARTPASSPRPTSGGWPARSGSRSGRRSTRRGRTTSECFQMHIHGWDSLLLVCFAVPCIGPGRHAGWVCKLWVWQAFGQHS